MGEASSSGKPAMRFLSFADDKEDAEKEAKLKEAAIKLEQAIAKEKALSELVDYEAEHVEEHQVDPANDTRSLYERLLEQKNRKKEHLEESQKLSNMITKLDEDDIEYLNEIAKRQLKEELKKRLQVQDALEAKKRLDEQKMIDEEQRMKEALLGKSTFAPKSSLSKSRMSSLIKMKTKLKSQNPADQIDEHQIKTSTSQQPHSNSRKPPSTSTNKPDKSPDDPCAIKRSAPDNQREEPNANHPNESESVSIDRACECICPQKVMASIGILPSMPIVKKAHDSSEEDSDYSDDDLNGRLVPRGRKRRR